MRIKARLRRAGRVVGACEEAEMRGAAEDKDFITGSTLIVNDGRRLV